MKIAVQSLLTLPSMTMGFTQHPRQHFKPENKIYFHEIEIGWDFQFPFLFFLYHKISFDVGD